MDWVRILACITGTVNQELLLRNEYLTAENRIIKAQLKTLLRLTDGRELHSLKSPIALFPDQPPVILTGFSDIDDKI